MINGVLQFEGVGAVFIQRHREHVTTTGRCRQDIANLVVRHRIAMAGQARRTINRIGQIVIAQTRRGPGSCTIRTIIDGDQIAIAETQITARRQAFLGLIRAIAQIVFINRTRNSRTNRILIDHCNRHIVGDDYLKTMIDCNGTSRRCVAVAIGRFKGGVDCASQTKVERGCVFIQTRRVIDATD